MKTVPDVVDADTSLVVGQPEVRVEIDRARAADLGVSVGDVAQALNTLVAGQKASTFNQGADQYNIRTTVPHERHMLDANDHPSLKNRLGEPGSGRPA